MKSSLTVRLQPELLEAAKPRAACQHRSLTDFIGASPLIRIGDVGGRVVVAQASIAQTFERPSRGE